MSKAASRAKPQDKRTWKRQTNESARLYQLFSYFLTSEERGPDRLRAVSSHFGLTFNHIRDLAYKHKWISRAKAFDDNKLRQAALDALAVEPHISDWKQRYEADQAELRELRQQLIEQARAILDYQVTTKTRRIQRVKRDRQGRVKQVFTVITNPPRWTMKDAAAMVSIAERLTRLTINMPSNVIELMPEFVGALRRSGFEPVEFMRRIIERSAAS